ncbi:MAG: type I restriction endonuclease [Cetobacterium sp.]|uniref:type I restriction endonuclease n=1 Tax=Cetobacterium sp. TaxID=2071632 RepID=UPI003F2F0C7B
MELRNQIEDLGKKIKIYKERISNEEMTKTAFILPFFEALGYDTRNPFEFHPEFTADLLDSKGEKVDYAILNNDKPQILIEAKSCNDNLDKHDKQLMRYFHTTEAKIGILTNGIIYKFYTDLDEPNKMDIKPFLEIDLLNIKDTEINELKKFSKKDFDILNILTSAEELKYSGAIKKLLKVNFDMPSESFSNYILGEIYDGIKTQKVKDKFALIIKKSLNEFLNDIVRTKLEGVLENNNNNLETSKNTLEVEENDVESIAVITKEEPETTQEELEGLGIVKSILIEFLGNEISRVEYKDTISYFGILLDGNIRKWICRLRFNTENKYIAFPEVDANGNKTNKEIKYLLNGLNDIYNYKNLLKESLDLYI